MLQSKNRVTAHSARWQAVAFSVLPEYKVEEEYKDTAHISLLGVLVPVSRVFASGFFYLSPFFDFRHLELLLPRIILCLITGIHKEEVMLRRRIPFTQIVFVTLLGVCGGIYIYKPYFDPALKTSGPQNVPKKPSDTNNSSQ